MRTITEIDYQNIILEVGKAQQRAKDWTDRIAALEAERDQLRKERDAANERADKQLAMWQELNERNIKLTAEVAGLREDKARLDWLWDNGWIDIGDDDGKLTLREALDAARKQG